MPRLNLLSFKKQLVIQKYIKTFVVVQNYFLSKASPHWWGFFFRSLSIYSKMLIKVTFYGVTVKTMNDLKTAQLKDETMFIFFTFGKK